MAATKKAAASAGKAAPKKAAEPAAKAPVKKAPAKKTASKSPEVKPAAKKSAAKPAVKKPAAKKAPAVKAPAGKAPAAKSSAKPAAKLVVREDESPWTKEELAAVRKELLADHDRLEQELAMTEADIADLVRDSGDGAGDDQADAGSKTFEREQEMSLANNARDMLLQTERALTRIKMGTYGVCEICSKPIGKYRLQAFPRATLCKACKEAEERY